ncbi:MAG: branched-chain amino acid ABC transporter permease, partial [Armatimonadota bacterium]|nr:branched-chain amino acid ABC transporter permease [Armatimonadota bacterium]
MDLRVLSDVLVGGLAAGAVYALMALGLVLIYKTTDVVNFAHGDMATVSTFVAYALAVQAGWPVLAAALLAMGFAALLGAAMELGLLQPARLGHASVLGLVVVTLGAGLTLNGLAGVVWGHDVKSFPFLLTGPPLRAGELLVPVDQLLNL